MERDGLLLARRRSVLCSMEVASLEFDSKLASIIPLEKLILRREGESLCFLDGICGIFAGWCEEIIQFWFGSAFAQALEMAFGSSIYQFGDSLSDTGNYVRSDGAHSQFSHPPYGQTFFHHPTGRCTDGLLMIDYIAESLQFPYLDPYLKKDGNFNHGVNFAVAASTALDLSTLASKHIPPPNTNNSLSVQLGWFRSYLSSICHNPSDCKDKLRNALFFMGEIGGNDMFAMSQRKNMEDLYNLVPQVNQAIVNAVKEVIDHGAVRVVVPGNLPVGCMPVYLLRFETNDQAKYDELNCLKHLNDFANLQNDELQKALRKLQQEHPHVAIVYGDLFNPTLEILRSANALGFDKDSTLKVCCGMGDNAHNYDWGRMCGFEGVPACSNPDARINWDGIHLTSRAYQHMAKSLLNQIIPALSRVN